MNCPNNHYKLMYRICLSDEGYFVGFWCDHCGLLERSSDYLSTREEAEKFQHDAVVAEELFFRRDEKVVLDPEVVDIRHSKHQ